jgi:hypothetical protein
MKIEQHEWNHDQHWSPPTPHMGAEADLVIAFGGTAVVADAGHVLDLRRAYPKAHIIGASTAGEILGTHVTDDNLVTTAVHFDQTRVRVAEVDIKECGNSVEAGSRLANALLRPGLSHVFVISDGQSVNGSDLARGLQENLPPDVAVTGGLAGDGSRFARTFVIADGGAHQGSVAAIGFYGSHLHVGFGSLGGWDSFGPQRLITKSKGNVLYELDGQPALALYRRYLGEHAAGLPATGLLFPLSVTTGSNGHEGEHEVVRTILAIDEADQSLTFAGDVPEGAHARLMKANFDRLVEGAQGAARSSHAIKGEKPPELAILISCVGRKLVLKQRTEEEVEAVREVMGPSTAMTGFYSYGEICPSAPNASCELHNQTMTITTLREG